MASDWTNGEPRIATAEDVKAPWEFRCGFCGHRILKGERWCFVYTNDLAGAGGNPLACQECINAANFRVTDGTGTGNLRDVLRDTWAHQCEEWRALIADPKWWQFVRGLRAEIQQERG